MSRFGLTLPKACIVLGLVSGFDFSLSHPLYALDDLGRNVESETQSKVTSLSESAKERIAKLIEEAINEQKLPGCVVCVGDSKSIIHLEAYGSKQLEPEKLPMTVDAVFDMASITKPVATGSSIMKLVEQGKLRLNDTIVSFFPEFGNKGKEELTVVDLMVHRSGLIPDNALADYLKGPEIAWEKICELPLTAPIGTTFKYSDVNFIVLGKLVEKISGKDLNTFAREEVFLPAGMTESGFNPPEELKARSAPTEKRSEQWIQGVVHDPRAFELGGIAGHAGLFSTAADMAKYGRMFLNRGVAIAEDGTTKQVFAPATLELMARGVPVASGIRGLSWDKQTGFSSNKGDLLSSSSVGHGGFTGTVFWVDPAQDLYVIFLSNRVHPNGKGSVNHLAGRLWNVVASDLAKAPVAVPSAPVLTGLDVLQNENYKTLAGQRVGLITNHTAVNATNESIVSLFSKSESVQLTALFSPEHGFEGKLDREGIEDSKDEKTGLKIYSLYGATRKPTEEMLKDVDLLVFDIQDIGARFYTYVSTMGEAMRAASEFKKKFVVLDRPNPINGIDVAGPMRDDGSDAFVAYHDLPVQHGMTVGEIAMMLNEELKLGLDLEVVKCEGWTRDRYYDSTGLLWVNPSPNMRALTQAILYPGIGLWESTNISVGRGTDTPFEWIGAPWMNGMELARNLNRIGLPGIRFVPVEFQPNSSKHADKLCKGVRFEITDRAAFKSVRTGLAIAVELRKLHPEDWELKNLNTLLRCKEIVDGVTTGKSLEELEDIANKRMMNFMQRRAKVLLY